MTPKPIALLPCWLCLVAAGRLISRVNRRDWQQEWLAELWHRWQTLQFRGEWSVSSALHLYASACDGCFRDAWYQLIVSEDRWAALRTQMRAPSSCAALLVASLLFLGIASGSFPATRTILGTLPYANSGRLALVTRTGRLESIRRGIPSDIAAIWLRDSKLVEDMAASSFVRPTTAVVGTLAVPASALQATGNLFDVLGTGLAPVTAPGVPVAMLSYSFWQHELHADAKVVGQSLRHNHREYRVAGVLPPNFWFVSPSVQIYELDSMDSRDRNLLVVRARPAVSAYQLEEELIQTADRNDRPFLQTAPHVLFLTEAVHTPMWLFGSSLLIASILVGIGHGFHLRHSNRSGARHMSGHRNCIWWVFLLAKTSMGLLLVFTAGIEVFIGLSHQFTTEPLGGPGLLWFYTAGCSGVLFAVIRDQQARCRVCLQGLAFPIRIGCPGCLFLDWAGTELLCPDGHGVLYVPDHLCCWDEAERWVALEI